MAAARAVVAAVPVLAAPLAAMEAAVGVAVEEEAEAAVAAAAHAGEGWQPGGLGAQCRAHAAAPPPSRASAAAD